MQIPYLENHHNQIQSRNRDIFQRILALLNHMVVQVNRYTHKLGKNYSLHFPLMHMCLLLSIPVINASLWLKKCFCRSVWIIRAKRICEWVINSNMSTCVYFNKKLTAIYIQFMSHLNILTLGYGAKICPVSRIVIW